MLRISQKRCTLLGSLLIWGCGSTVDLTQTDAPEVTGKARQILAAPQTIALTFAVPANVSASDLAFSVASDLTLGDRATVATPAGQQAAIAGLGTGVVSLGANAQTGHVWAAGSVDLRTDAAITGDLHVTHAPTKQTGVTISGQTITAPIATTTVRRSVTFPGSNQGPVNLEQSEQRSLMPDAYSDVTVKSGAVLSLSAGVYYLNSLSSEPGSQLVLDKRGGPIVIYVRTGLSQKGTVVEVGGAKADVFIGFFGTTTVFMESPLVGTLVAPSAGVVLATTAQPHVGAVYAKTVELRADAHFQFVPLPSLLISNVTTDKTTLCANDSVLVHVDADAAGAAGGLEIAINGNAGNDQHVQLTGSPGIRRISVTAGVAGGYASFREVIVQVVACSTPVLPLISTQMNRFHEYTVDFNVPNQALLGTPSPTFTWDFGDGSPKVTGGAFASHDYSARLARDKEYTVFTTQLRVTQAGAPDRVVTRSATVFNMYAFNKRRGTLQPPVTYNPTLALDAAGANWTGNFSIQNLEDVPVKFTAQQLEFQACSNTQEPVSSSTQIVNLQVPARSTLTVPVSIPKASVPAGTCRIGLHASGSSSATPKATLALYFDVAKLPKKALTNPGTLNVIKQIIDQHLVPNPDLITEEQIYNLVQSGKVAPIQGDDRSFLAPTPPLQDECAPGDTPPRPGVSCQAAFDPNNNPEERIQGAIIANALKGDVVLSRACGIVGALLSKVNPPQLYSHTGIMIRYNDTIRDSTAIESRFGAYPHDGTAGQATDGIEEAILKYGWPGTITQSVDQAFRGQTMTDPQRSTSNYRFTSFNPDAVQCSDGGSLISPHVLKADPLAGSTGRAPLLAAANFAENQANQGHYRFWGYSQMDQAALSIAPASAGWAAGSNGTMCSGFLWTAFKGAGVTLEGSLIETRDIGAVVRPGTPDGLYSYSSANREAAAGALYSNVYNVAKDTAGTLGILLTDAADDVANQIVNCFAKDNCSPAAKDDSSWRDAANVGGGVSVSPDDLFFWDVYPTNEPIVYRQAEMQRVYRWGPSVDSGNVSGVVTFLDGSPAPNANVVIAGVDTVADGIGHFDLQAILSGTYQENASKQLIDGLYAGKKDIVVVAGSTVDGSIVLSPPPDHFRQVQLVGSFHITDDETIGDETGDLQILELVNLDLAHAQADRNFSKCVGGEVRLEVKVHLELQTDFSVNAFVHSDFFEGGSCDTDDKEDQNDQSAMLPKDQQQTLDIRVVNSGLGGGDHAEGSLTVKNAVQP